jgi:hypothetical protein
MTTTVKTYVSIAPLTLVARTNGTMQYVYFGQVAPSDPADGEIERLTAEGYLAEVEVPAEAVEATQPVKSAGKADWVNWAIAQGADPGKAGSASKDSLIEAYGPDGTDELRAEFASEQA